MPPLITYTFLHLEKPEAKFEVEAYSTEEAWFFVKTLLKHPNMWELKK